MLVQDNLNTHTPGSLYEAFAPEEAKRLAQKLETHYTPKPARPAGGHGSWLNMAEIELGVLTRQCLSKSIPTKDQMIAETSAWQRQRNEADATVEWRFTTELLGNSGRPDQTEAALPSNSRVTEH